LCQPLAVAWCKESVVTHLDKALGQDVLEEAADKLIDWQRAAAQLPAGGVLIALPTLAIEGKPTTWY
jgi:hypothetical protein